jgi:signal transduction histidine kinase
VPLEGRSLFEAVGRLVDDFARRGGAMVEYRPAGAHFPVPTRLEVAIYRITQEALANVEQHAAARRVRVELAATPADLRLIIADDGRGFRPEDIPAGHYGLAGINERARLLGGRFELHSSPGAGTQLTVTIPLDLEND